MSLHLGVQCVHDAIVCADWYDRVRISQTFRWLQDVQVAVIGNCERKKAKNRIVPEACEDVGVR